jgi:hypothetical protein
MTEQGFEVHQREEEKKRKTKGAIRAAEKAAARALAPVEHRTRTSLGARAPPLEYHYRYKELRALGIVPDWGTLLDWIAAGKFPAGLKISHKFRIWPESQIAAFLAQYSETVCTA